jgi:hypothetical protein
VRRLVVRRTPPSSAPSGDEVVVVLGDVSPPAAAPWRTAEDYVDERARDAIDEAAIGWTKQWGRCPLVDGRSFRELLTWKGVSLWWFAELFLHHCTESPRYVRLIETLHRILDAERPQEPRRRRSTTRAAPRSSCRTRPSGASDATRRAASRSPTSTTSTGSSRSSLAIRCCGRSL